jgi:hypothetical protein
VIDKPANQELCRFGTPPAKSLDLKQLEKGRNLLKLGASVSSLNRLHAPVLGKLVEECGKLGEMDASQNNPKKKDMIELLMVSAQHARYRHA